MSKLFDRTWILIAASAAIKIWIVEAQSLFVISRSPHDDLGFLVLARNLLEGKWLGEYTNLTLIKGPFYPGFIATTFLSGIPLLLAQQCLYIAACLTFVIALAPILRKSIFCLVLFMVLLFNPMSFDISTTRVLREGIYYTLVLFVFAFMFGLLIRQNQTDQRVWTWTIGLGLSLTAFWLTREEGIWILPCIVLTIAIAVWKTRPSGKRDYINSLKPWIYSLSMPVIFTLVVSGLNLHYYGIFAKTEFDSKVFTTAYGSLTRVNVSRSIPYVPVSRKTRMNIYDISPAFLELKAYLEGDLGKGWAEIGTKTPENRKEILGGWFMWAFRDAVAQAGYYSSGKFPADYYLRLTREIDEACNHHLMDCLPPRSTMIPPLGIEDLPKFSAKVLQSGADFLGFKEVKIGCPSGNYGSGEASWLFWDLTREIPCREVIKTAPQMPLHHQSDTVKASLMRILLEMYQTLTPTATILATLVLIVYAILRSVHKPWGDPWLLAAVLASGVILRFLVVALFEYTSTPQMTLAYYSSGYPPLLGFIVLIIFGILDQIRFNQQP